ncbi:hypothetical protein RRG08_047171 [Elysia crispata]|uniref:Uncharacterized protein n=1 Tax=Elysia crispata TaxID=231223 RepID=A0AAE0YNV2_9GAST|nr:hypothetical protein RRG08_047171 [Elysia crispata]
MGVGVRLASALSKAPIPSGPSDDGVGSYTVKVQIKSTTLRSHTSNTRTTSLYKLVSGIRKILLLVWRKI